ncbi:nucleotide sugar dehydrogenase [Streptomyces halstedii]|uniref:Nucleotide sugar dehydrogenase n=1 Tax=Streptomyces halstedii TaxID=1944 RepID=A0ABS6TS25_STRHA|nr:nucleotide sugar dehydrogenase [Streptomyces halstedii]MBV7671068.1 nucleotide sugar dehydrogenase [Streptomyces halstedii]
MVESTQRGTASSGPTSAHVPRQVSAPSESRTADLVVVGLGHVGLPLARSACAAGLRVRGLDVSDRVASGLGAGRSHVGGVTDAEVTSMLAQDFRAGTDPEVVRDARTVVICVPTGLIADGGPDLAQVEAAAGEVARRLTPGTLVVLESTSYPGTTEQVVKPLLEKGSGLVAGQDFFLAYSPQRIDPGNREWGVENTPKIVSGYTTDCARRAVAFYSPFIRDVVLAKGTREAEMAKLLENTYRYVNIALVDEVALYCRLSGIDVWDVLHCAGTKPFGFGRFAPGPGVGGHCIPVDPRYLATEAERQGYSFRLLDAARQVLDSMPGHVAQRALGVLDDHGIEPEGARVLLLGVTYKPDVADIRETPARAVAAVLAESGVQVSYHDPYVEHFRVGGVTLPRATDLDEALEEADLVVLLQLHTCYDLGALGRRGRPLLDTRGTVVTGRFVTPL